MNYLKIIFKSKILYAVFAFLCLYLILLRNFLIVKDSRISYSKKEKVKFGSFDENLKGDLSFAESNSIAPTWEDTTEFVESTTEIYSTTISKLELIANLKKCYEGHDLSEDVTLFEDVLESSKKPSMGKSIFFHETSCSKDGQLHLNARQACAIESAALMNPNSDVFLLVLSPAGLSKDTTPVIKAIQSYPNIYFRNLNLWKYSEGTPTEDWVRTNAIFDSSFLLNHLADFLRYLSLWKYGGTYLDMDVILKKTLEDLPPNYTGAESDDYLAIGAMNFDHKGIGHEIVEKCLRNLQENFDGSQWSFNGNGVLTRVLQEVCQTISASNMTSQRCNGFKVYPPPTFYAIEYWRWQLFFEENELNNAMYLTKNSILIHVWNKLSKDEKVKVGSKVAYGVYAAKFCPKVYSSCGEFF